MGSVEPIPSQFWHFYNIVNGKLRESDKVHRSIDPSTRKPLWEIPIATQKDLDDAVAAGKKAFKSWSAKSWDERGEYLLKLKDVLQEHEAEFTELLMKESGKPRQWAALEVRNSGHNLTHFASARIPEEEVTQDDDTIRLSLRWVPLGVVGAIVPWNFPLVLAMGKICNSLITGNVCIVKPSPFTPYSAVKFVEIAQHILPPGVLQALNGDDRLGPAIVAHPGVDKISFTGSTPTGKRVMETAAKTLKPVTLELGGNSATIVCEDVDIEKAAKGVALGSFFNSGQLCVASKRIYVHESIYQDFLEAYVKEVGSWKVAPASEDGTMLGPVQNEMQYNIVKDIFEDSKKKGYKFALGGEIEENTENLIIKPAIVDNPPDDAIVVTKEQFGPIAPVQSWSTEDELLERVNNTNTGLGGAVWCADIDRAQRLARRIEAGTIWINSYEIPLAQAYFQGHKESGVGGEGGYHGLLAYCNAQAIHQYKAPVGKVSS